MLGRIARVTALTWATAAGAACVPAPDPAAPRAMYDAYTSRLIQLSADQNGDGRLDQWSYLDGNRPLRGEADSDGDGRIDRWEYFDATAALTHVGTSSANDGVEDTWTWVTGSEMRVDRSRQRDRHVDRREYYAGDTLLRAEEDTNADGRPDRWDSYEGTVLRQVAFDTTLAAGRPNRRIVYDAQGRFQHVEGDDDGDGIFVVLSGVGPDAIEGVKR